MTDHEIATDLSLERRPVSRRSVLGLMGAVPLAAAGMWTASVAGSAAATPVTGTSAPEDVAVGDVQQAMEAIARTAGVVGAIGEVYVDGRRAGHGSAGSRLLGGRGGRVPSDARYRIASQSKAMVSAVVRQLTSEGGLDIEDKLARLLPEVVALDLVEHAYGISVRDLLRHTSGIPDFMAGGGFDVFDFRTYHPPLELVKAARAQPRPGPVGTFHYSTTNYILLGLIIERTTRQPLPEVLAERLFVPLGMTRTYLPTRPPQGIRGPHAHGYHPDANGRPRDVDRLNASSCAVQSVVSTAHDISAFQRAFDLGTLVPGAPKPQPPGGGQLPPGVCGVTPALRSSAGSIAGCQSVTYSSPDGRLQFAISVTLAVSNMEFDDAPVKEAVKAVLCPAA